MPLAPADAHVREAVALARAYGPQRCRLAHDGVPHAEGPGLRQALRAETPNLLVRRQDEHERSCERAHLRLLYGRERSRDEALRVARPAPVKVTVALRESQRIRPRRVERHGVGVADEREFYFVAVGERARVGGHEVELLDAALVRVREQTGAQSR